MKIITNKTLQELIDNARKEGYKEGYTKGYNTGIEKGLKADKTGVHLNNAGLFVFDDKR